MPNSTWWHFTQNSLEIVLIANVTCSHYLIFEKESFHSKDWWKSFIILSLLRFSFYYLFVVLEHLHAAPFFIRASKAENFHVEYDMFILYSYTRVPFTVSFFIHVECSMPYGLCYSVWCNCKKCKLWMPFRCFLLLATSKRTD